MAVGGVVLVLMSQGDDGDSKSASASAPAANSDSKSEPKAKPKPEPEPEEILPESTCEPGLSNCTVASGRVVYVEKVDPDGDGDAHFVTASGSSVTGPGITIFDVRTDLRPEPLPGIGDLVGGAGPVFPGSRGQLQIEVTEFHVAN